MIVTNSYDINKTVHTKKQTRLDVYQESLRTQLGVTMRLLRHLLQVLVQYVAKQLQRRRLDRIPADGLADLGHDDLEHLLCIRRTHADAGSANKARSKPNRSITLFTRTLAYVVRVALCVCVQVRCGKPNTFNALSGRAITGSRPH